MSVNNYSQLQNTLYPGSGVTPVPTLRSSDGILDAYGTVVPVAGTAGYIVGATFKKTNGGADTSLYINEGSVTSSNFVPSIADVPQAYGSATGRGPSPEIWNDCPVLDYELNPQNGFHVFDDLQHGIVVAANKSVSEVAALNTTGDWAAFTLTGTAISTLATDIHGVVTLTVTTDEDADCRIAYPQNIETAGMFSFVVGKKLWMEARVKVDNVTNAKMNTFIGFMKESQMATGELIAVAGGVTADVAYVAFRQNEADGDAWRIHYNTSGHSVVSDTAGVITINAWHKLGIYSDGVRVYFFIDGVQLADSVLLSAANFPNGEELGFYFGIVAASADSIVGSIDWLRVAQEY